MRFVKILGLVTVMALVAIAFAGAGTASAVKLCKKVGNGSGECPAGEEYLAREYKAKLEAFTMSAIFETDKIKAECSETTLTFKTTASSATPLPGEVTGLTVGSCGKCKVEKVLGLPYSFGIIGTGDKDGILSATKKGSTPGIELTGCPGAASCTFSAKVEQINLDLKGGGPGQTPAVPLIKAVNEPYDYVSGSGENVCGQAGKFTALYEVFEPTAVWVTAK